MPTQKAMFIEVLEDKKEKNKFCYYGKYRKKRFNKKLWCHNNHSLL
jgi:hypothetical protein